MCELTFQDLLLSRYIFWYLHIIVGPTLYQFPKKSLRKSIFTAYMIELCNFVHLSWKFRIPPDPNAHCALQYISIDEMTCILKSAGVQLAEWRASLEYLTSKSAEHRPQRGSKHLKQTALSLQFGDIYE